MDMEILRKKISTYRTDGGYVKNLPNDLLMEILSAWEQWTGPGNGFYSAIGVNAKRMASVIGKAKKLRREGHFPVEEFKELKVEALVPSPGSPLLPYQGVEILWENGRLIRFSQVDQLVDFLKKVA